MSIETLADVLNGLSKKVKGTKITIGNSLSHINHDYNEALAYEIAIRNVNMVYARLKEAEKLLLAFNEIINKCNEEGD